MHTPNIDSVLNEELFLDSIGEIRPYKIGVPIKTNTITRNDFLKENINEELIIYRLKFSLLNSKSIGFTFKNFKFSENSKLYIYNNEAKDCEIPFLDYEIDKLYDFSTFPVSGDTVIIEIIENIKDSSLNFELNYINYGIRSIKEYVSDNFNLVLAQSGSCNKNVNCSEGNDWCREKYSVGLILLQDGSALCSGSLLNNQRLDFKPYFLTAFHCLDREKPRNYILSQNEKDAVQTWSFKFGFIQEFCSSGSGLPTYNYNGATYRAAWNPTDFALVELNTQPKSGENNFKDVYFNGWDRTGNVPSNVTAIHHPSGDFMKISTSSISPQKSSLNGIMNCLPDNDHYYWFVNWTSGVTEGGSSGSSLFDDNHRVIGQLYGGCSYCNAPSNKLNDGFGRLSVSWSGGGTNDTRLSNWLDPDNTGISVLDGIKLPFLLYGAGFANASHNRTAYNQMKVGSGTISGWDFSFVLNTAASLNLKAGNEIVIKPCTRFKSGSNFRAYIETPSCTEIMYLSNKETDYIDVCTHIYSKISIENDEVFYATKLNSTFTLSPNPADESIRVSYQITGSGKLYLRSSLGVDLIPSIALENAKGIENIDISKFPVGIYLISIESDSGIHTDKFVISR